MDSKRAIVVHRNKIVRHHLADFLTAAGMEVVSDVNGLEELEVKARLWRPHVIVLDIHYASHAFPVFLKNFKQKLSEAKWVLTGPEPHEYYARQTAALGADLYLSETQHPHEWLRGLDAITP
jgi:DNA-binding NarL/FixJ family response regulator